MAGDTPADGNRTQAHENGTATDEQQTYSRAKKKATLETATHLVVMQHGLLGSSADFSHFARLFRQHFSFEGVYIQDSDCNNCSLFQTYDGVDCGGERLADEICALEKRMPCLQKISIIGHSLGGLYARFCIGLLLVRGFFERIQPMNFITLATPHLGVRRPPRGSFNFIINALTPTVFHRTGQQLNLADVASDEVIALGSNATDRQGPRAQSSFINTQGTVLASISSSKGTLEAFEFHSCTVQDDILTLKSISDRTDTLSETPVFSINLRQAEVILEVSTPPTSHRHSTLRKTLSFRQWKSERSLETNGIEDNPPDDRADAWDVYIRPIGSTDPTEQAVLRIGDQGLSNDWRWLITFSINSLGVRCRTKTAVGSTKNSSLSDSSPPLLSCLARGRFLEALLLFQVRTAYANVFFDVQVPFASGSIRAFNPYRLDPSTWKTDETYPHITRMSLNLQTLVRSTLPTSNVADIVTKTPQPFVNGKSKQFSRLFSSKSKEREERGDRISVSYTNEEKVGKKRPDPFMDDEVVLDRVDEAYKSDAEQDELRGMLLSLQSVGWRRVHVMFENVLAHEHIIAKRASEKRPLDYGLDIVHHVMDTFALS